MGNHMKKQIAVLGVFSFLCGLAMAPEVAATTNATVYLVHGLPGADLGKAADLPVDISFNGMYKAKAFKHPTVSAALSLAAGTYAVNVYEAGMGPAAGTTPLIRKSIVLKEGEQASVVIHLTGAKKATLTKFTNDLSPVANKSARYVVHNTAAVSYFGAGFVPAAGEGHPLCIAEAIGYRNRFAVELDPKWGAEYFMGVIESSPDSELWLKKMLQVAADKVHLIYIVGTPKTATFQAITKTFALR